MKGAPNKSTVLVVDDEQSGAEALGILLEQAGYQVRVAHGGVEAIELAARSAPDVVLLDARMPGMDGFETCERLHQLPGLADLPVIFLTGSDEHATIARAFGAGALDYVTKPFAVEELLARVRTHADLKRSRDHLGRMLREREEITHVVAHDLKNPLTGVLFAAELLSRPVQRPERREELVAEIIEQTRVALELIQRFLSRGAEGQRLRQFAAQRVNLLDLAHQAVRAHRSAAEAREMTLNVGGDPAEANVDPAVTRNVLGNLISNAIQYSPERSTVDVQVSKLPSGFAQCRVMDRGPGIAPEDQAKLFTRFLHLASASSRTQYSSGLGLAIAKHDVTQMGGYLWFEPREGGGSVFGFDLPAP
jgi:signal transduction histidine kinase